MKLLVYCRTPVRVLYWGLGSRRSSTSLNNLRISKSPRNSASKLYAVNFNVTSLSKCITDMHRSVTKIFIVAQKNHVDPRVIAPELLSTSTHHGYGSTWKFFFPRTVCNPMNKRPTMTRESILFAVDPGDQNCTSDNQCKGQFIFTVNLVRGRGLAGQLIWIPLVASPVIF